MEQFIREPECQKITGLSRPTRWRLEKANQFPKRYQISPNAVGWLSSEIEDWIQTRSKISLSSTIQGKKRRGSHHEGK